jgi:hypothetical protein
VPSKSQRLRAQYSKVVAVKFLRDEQLNAHSGYFCHSFAQSLNASSKQSKQSPASSPR